jgi:anhydro-N-acetylmuramic acid kinase
VNPVQRLLRLAARPERLALGLMSGMSMDGLDLALVRVSPRADGRRACRLLVSETRPYPPELAQRIRAAVEGTTAQVARLHRDLASHWADDVLAFLREAGVAPESVDVIGSHGQTIHHTPRGEGGRACTLQVGDGDVLAHETGILTVSDFRARDVAAGGEGAPLVPFADWLAHAQPGRVLACHNLGSIANVTVVTPRREDVLAFDTGPANALVDALARACGAPEGIDRDGAVSAGGNVHQEALAFLERSLRAFLERPPPKSAGFAEIGPALAQRLLAAHGDVPGPDLVRTAVECTARAFADAYRRHVLPRHPSLREVRLSGGGTRNPTLVARIRAALEPLGLSATPFDDAYAKAKEAVAFALLADATVSGLPGNLPSATGASAPVVLGKISL